MSMNYLYYDTEFPRGSVVTVKGYDDALVVMESYPLNLSLRALKKDDFPATDTTGRYIAFGAKRSDCKPAIRKNPPDVATHIIFNGELPGSHCFEVFGVNQPHSRLVCTESLKQVEEISFREQFVIPLNCPVTVKAHDYIPDGIYRYRDLVNWEFGDRKMPPLGCKVVFFEPERAGVTWWRSCSRTNEETGTRYYRETLSRIPAESWSFIPHVQDFRWKSGRPTSSEKKQYLTMIQFRQDDYRCLIEEWPSRQDVNYPSFAGVIKWMDLDDIPRMTSEVTML